MNMKDLVYKARSTRRFNESEAISRETLEGLVDLARVSPSGGNGQPLKYYLACDAETNGKIFPNLRWAGALPDWDGPAEGERPAAYVILLCDTAIAGNPGCDHGIAAQTMMLAAADREIAACMLGAIDRDGLREAIGLDPRYNIALVLALGKPAETIVLDEVPADGSTKYWRDGESVHHVPKRTLKEIVIN